MKGSLVSVLAIILVSLVCWSPILRQSLRGESLHYFLLFSQSYSKYADSLIYDKIANPFWGHAENIGRILFYLQSLIFKDNFIGYLVSELIVVITLHVTFFLVLKKITKNILLSFVAGLLLATDFTGSYENFSYYAYFIWKIPTFILIFISVLLFTEAFKKLSFKKLIVSIFLYAISIALSNYSLLFIPFFFTYSFWYTVFYYKKNPFSNKRVLFLASVSVISLLAVGLISTLTSAYSPSQFKEAGYRTAPVNPISFFKNDKNAVQEVLMQLTTVTTPSSITNAVKQKTNSYPMAIQREIPFVILFYLVTVFLILKKGNYKVLALSSFCALVGSFFVNLYIDRIDINSELIESRYYFVPAIFFAIFIGILISSIFKRLKYPTDKGIVILFLVFIFISRYNNISVYFSDREYTYTASNILVNWAKTHKDTFSKETTVFYPGQVLTTSGLYFLEMYYGEKIDFREYYDKNDFVNVDPNDRSIIYLEFDKNGKTGVKLIEANSWKKLNSI